MKTSVITVIAVCSLLVGCGSVGSVPDPELNLLTKQTARLVAGYNHEHGTQFTVPRVVIDDRPDEPTMIASASYALWTITVNKAWIRKDPCLVYKEAIAHELAHLLVDYQQYGEPQVAVLSTHSGLQVVAFNGPPMLRDSADEHGKAWQAMARELGAHPCEEGYCYSVRPYKKFPLVCANIALADNQPANSVSVDRR